MLSRKFKLVVIVFIILSLVVVGRYEYYRYKYMFFPSGSVVMYFGAEGLGNQMFRYAAGYSLAKKTNSKLYVIVDKVSDKAGMSNAEDRNFILNKFNIPKDEIIYKDQIDPRFFDQHNKIATIGYKDHPLKQSMKESFNVTYVDDVNFFDLYKIKNKQILFMNDFFESEIYFEDVKSQILELFAAKQPSNHEIISEINDVSKENSFCVHIRKGDMLIYNEAYYLPTNYQKQAIALSKKLVKNAKFFVFSDSMHIAKEELDGIEDFTFINHAPLDDFVIMSNCKNNIIANSTFSWWAAYLNNNSSKTVIAPYPRYSEAGYQYLYEDNVEKRYAKRRLYYPNSYPRNWIQLEYNSLDLADFAKKNIADQSKVDDILKDYVHKEFNFYSGDMIELETCEGKGEFSPNVCFANAKEASPTVVSAYYNIKSKFPKKQYIEWMKNFLSIPFNLVVYTDKENANLIRELRGDLPLVLIEKDLKELYHYKFYDRYKLMNKFDHNKDHSVELYIVWAEKVKFVNDAIKLNPYKSDFFVWTDIGMFREDEYISDNFPSLNKMIHNKMSFFAIEDFSSLDLINLTLNNDSVRIAGSPQIGNKFSWKLYDALWDLMIQDLMYKRFAARNDQSVIGTIKLKYPQFINLVYPDIRFKGNRWWYSLLYYSDEKSRR